MNSDNRAEFWMSKYKMQLPEFWCVKFSILKKTFQKKINGTAAKMKSKKLDDTFSPLIWFALFLNLAASSNSCPGMAHEEEHVCYRAIWSIETSKLIRWVGNDLNDNSSNNQ